MTGIAIALVLLLGLTDEGIAALFESGQGLGRMFVHTLGVRRNAVDIVAIVLSGTGTSREHIQRLGRILRAVEGKRALLYEVIAENTSEENTSRRRRS